MYYPTIRYDTKYGPITLAARDTMIGNELAAGKYWNDDLHEKLLPYIPRNRDIIEVGGQSGTDTIFYARLLDEAHRVYTFEPQIEMYTLLNKNVQQNSLQHKVTAYNKAVLSICGNGQMAIDPTTQNNPGGLGIGEGGEAIEFVTIDSMNFQNVGYIHCDAQGADLHVLFGATETIKRCRPAILIEDLSLPSGREFAWFIDRAKDNYPNAPMVEDMIAFTKELNYTLFYGFGHMDSLLVPVKADS
jgi:FkbM family methyltransferase